MPARRVATALAAALVVVGVLAAALSGPLSLEGRPRAEPTWTPVAATAFPTASASPTPTVWDEIPEPPAWFDVLARTLLALGGLVVLAVLGLLLRYATRGWRLDHPEPDDVPPGDDTGEELTGRAVAALREGVHAATRALDDDVPPGDAVIGAWVAVETAAGRTGVVRERAETASEYAVRVLGATRADPDATRALLALYLAARFSTHGTTPDDVRRARDLLDVVAAGLVVTSQELP